MRAIFTAAVLLIAIPAHAQTDEWTKTTAMPSSRPLWGSKIEVENQPCCALAHGLRTTDIDEAAVLSTVRDRAVRDGPTLWLKLAGNRSLKITDCDDESPCPAPMEVRSHRLAAWWPKFRYYVVDVGLYEGQMAYLIRETDGLVVRVPAPPVLSPDEQFAVSSNPDVENGSGDLEILNMRVDPPTVLPFQESSTCPRDLQEFGLITVGGDLRWNDNAHVLFTNPSFGQGNKKPKELLLEVIDGKSELECKF